MNDFDSKKLDGLLAAGKLDEAKKLITAIFTGPEKPNDKTDAAIDYALAYIKVVNKIQRDYLDSLNEAVDLLQKTKASEGKVNDTVKLAKLKLDLKK